MITGFLATHVDRVRDLVQDERRLNVALARRKKKLIILGDQSTLRTYPTFYGLTPRCKASRPQ